MNKIISSALASCLIAGLTSSLSAQDTTFNDASGTDDLISNAGNWSSGLPVGQTGGLNIDAGYNTDVNLVGYDVTHTAGTLSRSSGFSALNLNTNSVWVMDGATAAITSTRGINLVNGASFTLNDGNADLTDNNRDTQINGDNGSGTASNLSINGGIMTVGRDLIIRNGATFTITGGSLTISDQIFTQAFATAAGAINFNGGTTVADNFEFDTAGTVTFGGSSAGSLSLLTGLGNGSTLNWLTGSQMSLTIVGADLTFYENLYTGGDLLFESSNAPSFATNFQVSGETLSLVAIPEPSTYAMLASAIVLCGVMLRRRRS